MRMPQITLSIGANVRNLSQRVNNFSILGSVSPSKYEKTLKGVVQRTPKTEVNDPEWQHEHNDGLRGYFKKHDGFRDQELHNRKARGYTIRQGTDVLYYTTTFDPCSDPLYHEDNNRVIDRVFVLPIIFSFQPENDLYSRLGIQQMDETETYFHMGLFLELNYASLRKHGIAPKCPETEHNPVWSQRGYEGFVYHGYTFDQIGPKAGDKLKVEAFDVLYAVENVKDAAPEYQHRWRKYFWKVSIKDAHDLGEKIGTDVLEDPEQRKFINDLIGVNSEDGVRDSNGQLITNPFDVSAIVDELKKDVLYRPPEVMPDAPDISKDPNFTPGESEFGSW